LPAGYTINTYLSIINYKAVGSPAEVDQKPPYKNKNMKTIKPKNTFIIAAMLLFSYLCPLLPVRANTPYTTPDTGYWVVESNTHSKDFTVIKFYDAQHRLMYEERLEGVCLNIKKRKHIKMLNNTLNMVETNRLVAGQLKNYKQQIASTLATKK
jgi:hypothetical protein